MNAVVEKKQIRIAIGAMCPSLQKQLRDQGFKVSASDVSHYQMAMDGFIRLRIMGCMGDKEADRIGQRLGSKITSAVQKLLNK